MTRIQVIPQQLHALGGQMESAAGSLRGVEGVLVRGLGALEWEVKYQTDMEDQIGAARARAASLAALSGHLARFLRGKADAFEQADRAGVGLLGGDFGADAVAKLPPHIFDRLFDPIADAMAPLWSLGALLGALPPIPNTADLFWNLRNWEKILHDLLLAAKHDWWRAQQAGDPAAMAEAHRRAELLRALGAKVSEDEERYINEMHSRPQTPPAAEAPPAAGDLVLDDVPLLKQAGQPWSDIKFTGKVTWAEWGCTATSMVMALKYVDPSIVVNREFMQRFRDHVIGAKDGYVYWNSPGTNQIMAEHGVELNIQWPGGDSEKAMSMALENLKQGIPSIIGVSSSDRSHWVLITGFTGDPANPRPEDFHINDPGRDRQTLNELFADYPGCTVDKIVTISKA